MEAGLQMSNPFLDRIYRKKNTGINFQNDWQDYCDSLKVERNPRPIRIMVYLGVLNVAGYRAFAPFMELAKRPEYDIRIGSYLAQQDDIDWADIIYFQRVVDRNIVSEAKRARAAKKKVLYDTDDYLHGLPDHHPQKRNIENSRYLVDQDDLCRSCNVITVSTDYLKKLYAQKYRKPIEVLPNCIRTEDYQSAPVNKFNNGRIYIGWGGSSTHYHDLTVAGPALRALMAENKNLSLITINYHGIDSRTGEDAFEGIPAERRICVEGTEPHMVGGVMSMIDIGIAPLLINDFNRAKSNVKFLEYSMCGIPMIASDLEPYRPDRNYSVLIGNNPEAWLGALKTLVRDEEQRCGLALRASRWTRERYDIRNNIVIWDNLFKRLTK
jgi:glycosyltransferase involved in cell wall biosynthesis